MDRFGDLTVDFTCFKVRHIMMRRRWSVQLTISETKSQTETICTHHTVNLIRWDQTIRSDDSTQKIEGQVQRLTQLAVAVESEYFCFVVISENWILNRINTKQNNAKYNLITYPTYPLILFFLIFYNQHCYCYYLCYYYYCLFL